MKYFNTAGPVNRPNHYKVDPLHRWNLDEILTLIRQEKYFILHAPRQTGKTSSLLALRDYLNAEGKYFSLYTNFEVAQAARNDIKSGIEAIVGEISARAYEDTGKDEMPDAMREILEKTGAGSGLNAVFSYLSRTFSRPLVLLIDEIDALTGDTLISVLRQIRAGYDRRPSNFPSTIILCGVHDIKDYRIHRSGGDIITGGSAFNIKAKSLRLGNFTQEEIRELYFQHTLETGQVFHEECFDLVWRYTSGQPWLVNALGNEVTHEMEENRDPSVTITPGKLEEAKERLILSRQTHLDQLTDKLTEDRIRRVILPMITGEEARVHKDDDQYCMDLGLITQTSRGLVISNDIYREIIPRELTEARQRTFQARFAPDWVGRDGRIDTEVMLNLFREFWMENADIWASHIKGYQEAAPQLVTQAFLQRVVNANGYIAREYASGRGRTDLMIKWRYEADGKPAWQKIVMEIKVIGAKQGYQTVKKQAIEQTAAYAVTCGVSEAHILIFDRDEKFGWRKKTFNDHGEHDGVKIKIWGF